MELTCKSDRHQGKSSYTPLSSSALGGEIRTSQVGVDTRNLRLHDCLGGGVVETAVGLPLISILAPERLVAVARVDGDDDGRALRDRN